MNEAKIIVLTNILRFDKPFKVSHIFQMSSLSRELTRYHISELVKQGHLEKNGVYYSISNRDGLLDLIPKASETSQRFMETTKLMRKVDGFNTMAQFIAAARKLNVPYTTEIKEEFVSWIDQTIKELKCLRTFVTSKGYATKTAKGILEGADLEEMFDAFIDVLGPEVSESVYTTTVMDITSKVDES